MHGISIPDLDTFLGFTLESSTGVSLPSTSHLQGPGVLVARLPEGTGRQEGRSVV
jgi:hypothetical protein